MTALFMLALTRPLFEFPGGTENDFLAKFSVMRDQSLVMVATDAGRVPKGKMPFAKIGAATVDDERDCLRLATNVLGRKWLKDAPETLMPVVRDPWELSVRRIAPENRLRVAWPARKGAAKWTTRGDESVTFADVLSRMKTRARVLPGLDRAKFRLAWKNVDDEKGLLAALATGVGGKVRAELDGSFTVVVDPPRFKATIAEAWAALSRTETGENAAWARAVSLFLKDMKDGGLSRAYEFRDRKYGKDYGARSPVTAAVAAFVRYHLEATPPKELTPQFAGFEVDSVRCHVDPDTGAIIEASSSKKDFDWGFGM